MAEHANREPGRIPVPLRLCRACRQFVRIENADCDFCGADLEALEFAHAEAVTAMRVAGDALRAALAERGRKEPDPGSSPG